MVDHTLRLTQRFGEGARPCIWYPTWKLAPFDESPGTDKIPRWLGLDEKFALRHPLTDSDPPQPVKACRHRTSELKPRSAETMAVKRKHMCSYEGKAQPLPELQLKISCLEKGRQEASTRS
jgi:hypothetical protein